MKENKVFRLVDESVKTRIKSEMGAALLIISLYALTHKKCPITEQQL